MKALRSLLLGLAPAGASFVAQHVAGWAGMAFAGLLSMLGTVFVIPISFWAAFGIADAMCPRRLWWNLALGLSLAIVFLAVNFSAVAYVGTRSAAD